VNEAVAEKILANKRLLYGTGIENHRKEVDKLGDEGLTLSKEYEDKKEAISNNENLTNKGKANEIEALYKDYNARAKAIIKKQQKLIADHEKEYSRIAEVTLKEIEKNASIRDFSETDMQYILYMLEHANNDFLLGMLEEYDFNPFLIKMVNARDSKLPHRINRPGTDPLSPNGGMKNPDKLEIEHPLKQLIERSEYSLNGLHTKVGSRTLSDLIPVWGVPSVDPWAQTEDVNPLWRR
jgi:hypothetical protein